MSKLCVFHGNQKDILTCLNPIEMVSAGVFDNRFDHLSPEVYSKLFMDKLKYHHSVASENLFEVNSKQPNMDNTWTSFRNRCKFFNWYIKFYYKMPNWEVDYPEMVTWHRQTIWKLFTGFKITHRIDHVYLKQMLLEIAWDYNQSPENLIPKP